MNPILTILLEVSDNVTANTVGQIEKAGL